MGLTKGGRLVVKVALSLVVILGIGTGLVAYKFYKMIYEVNVTVLAESPTYFYIKTGVNYQQVFNDLKEQGLIKNANSFNWVAERKKYPALVKPGRYLIEPKMNNNQLVNLLRSGDQKPLRVTFNNVRLLPEMAGQIGAQIEADSLSILSLITSSEIQQKYGFTKETFMSMFVPNTYEMYWNTSATQFVERMAKEYKAFWTAERKAKAKKLELSQSQVATLAAIVQKESSKNDEKPRIAGVYYNRIKKGMLLQADPTLIFALGDFTIHRVLNKHKLIESPYNTYKYKGLPPGPICVPEISSLDAVLNLENHDYIFFCAKEDFSGYHNFAVTYAQHRQNARKWQKALNARKIYR